VPSTPRIGRSRSDQRHIDALDREWDVERYLQMNAGLVSLSGVLLGGLVNRRFLLLPATVFGFFFQHARRDGARHYRYSDEWASVRDWKSTKKKDALKALRGDFDYVSPERQSDQEE
jgi:hypothetical protein